MHITIDRFEGNVAVVQKEDGAEYRMERALLPPQAKEGDVVRIETDGAATQTRRERIEKKMRDIWAD